MNNNLQKFLSSLDNFHKNIIIENSKNNHIFEKFILACSNLDISLYDGNKPKDYTLLLKKIYNFQEVIIKNLGVKLVKEYKNNQNNVIEFLEGKFKKTIEKVSYTNTIINILTNEIDSIKFSELLTKFVDNRKIMYTENIISSKKKEIEIIDFSHDIFVTSDEMSSEEHTKNERANSNQKNTPFIAEYSN